MGRGQDEKLWPARMPGTGTGQMFAVIADALSDPASVVYPIGGGAILVTMLKMIWSDRTRGARIETALRSTFAKERADREAEVTAEKATAKTDYQESLSRHKEIHLREIAAFQERITGYIEELGHTKGRVTTLEAEVKALDTEVAKLRQQ